MSERTFVIRPEATAEADDAHDHYREIDPSLGSRFLKRLHEAIDRIRNSPELYGAVWQDVRAKTLKKFPYVVYYRLHESFVEITAIMHGARDPSVWQSRV